MNEVGDWQTTARVMDPERRAMWEEIFGSDVIPIVSFVGLRANLPGHPDALVYMLDLKAITAEQRARLVKALAEKFDFDVGFVERNLDVEGVPILADHVSVSSRDRALVMGAVL